MSKNLLSNSNENLLRYSITNDNKAFMRKASKDQKTIDLKSPLKSSIVPKNSLNSPEFVPQKTGYAWINSKNAIEKSPSSLVVTVENFEVKENCSFETKLFSSPKKANKRNFASLYSDKSLAGLSKPVSSNGQNRVSQPRSPGDTYEGMSNKKLKKGEMGSQESTVVEKDARMSLLGEPSKKSSLPMNLKLTLEKICAKGGSSTHRGLLSPSPSESSAKFLSNKPKKSSRGNEEKNRSNSKAKCKLNTLLTGLNKPLADQNKMLGKLSLREFHSVNVTPRQGHKEVYSIVERSQIMKKYNGLLGMLQEKNNESKRLSQTKSELQSAMGESQSFRERVASYTDLKNGVNQDNKSHPLSPNLMKSVYLYRKDNKNGESGTPRMISSSSGFKNETKCFSDRSGKSWITAITNSKAVAGTSRENMCARKRNETSGERDRTVHLKTINEELGRSHPHNITNSQRSYEYETVSVDDGLRRRGSDDENLGDKKESLKEGLDIGKALNQLKNRIERLLKAKNKEDNAKTNMLAQSLKEHFQNVM